MIESVDKLREALGDCITRAGHKDKFDTYWITKDAADKLIDEIEAEIADRYMELPLDADEVPIRPGDKLIAYNERFDVEGIGDGTVIFRAENDELGELLNPAATIHVKPRALEDVLREFAGDYRRAMNAFEEGDEYGPSITELTARCAAEIRELMGGDAE